MLIKVNKPIHLKMGATHMDLNVFEKGKALTKGEGGVYILCPTLLYAWGY